MCGSQHVYLIYTKLYQTWESWDEFWIMTAIGSYFSFKPENPAEIQHVRNSYHKFTCFRERGSNQARLGEKRMHQSLRLPDSR